MRLTEGVNFNISTGARNLFRSAEDYLYVPKTAE
jgi:hypothetical protein